MAITVGARPSSISGKTVTWSEKQTPNVIRTSMENGTVKVRRRSTGIMRQAEATMILAGSLYTDFLTWWNTNCQQGALPTRVYTPYGAEEVWRITEPPSIEWMNGASTTFRASLKLERLPEFP